MKAYLATNSSNHSRRFLRIGGHCALQMCQIDDGFPRLDRGFLLRIADSRRTDLQACPGRMAVVYYHILTVHTDTVNIHHRLILNACCTHINHITCTQKIKSITFATLNDYMKCAKGYSGFHHSIVTLQDSEWLFKPCLHQTLDQELHEWCQAMFLATGKKRCRMRRWLCKEEPNLRTHHVHLWALEGFLNSSMNQKAVHVCLQIRFGRVFFLPLRFLFKDSDNKQMPDILQLLDIKEFILSSCPLTRFGFSWSFKPQGVLKNTGNYSTEGTQHPRPALHRLDLRGNSEIVHYKPLEFFPSIHTTHALYLNLSMFRKLPHMHHGIGKKVHTITYHKFDVTHLVASS